MPFQINLIAPPTYVVTTQTLERQDGLAKLNAALAVIKQSIEDSNGVFAIKLAVSSTLKVIEVLNIFEIKFLEISHQSSIFDNI